MGKPLKIYLADLTYDTLAVSANHFPLNIGYVASYANACFGSEVDIYLFKYISDLEEAVSCSAPDILGLNNSCWNHNLGREMFRMTRERKPDMVAVCGGPNFPRDSQSREAWMKAYDELDIYVPLEGELGFANIVERAITAREGESLRDHVLQEEIEGCVLKDTTGRVIIGKAAPRMKVLDDVPSPYQTGILDSFFDGRLIPMMQTNRGCPFTCAYCVDGAEEVRAVNKFGIDRVSSEVEYIAGHVPENIHYLAISDLNFGMIPQDVDICDILKQVRQKYDYPEYVGAATGKNAKESIIECIKKLEGALVLMIAVQSMDKQVLANINRKNISVEKMLELSPAIKEAGLKTKAEVILGLPGDSVDAHTMTLRTLINADMDEILTFTFMLLPGAKLFEPEERNKWDFIVKHRIIPRNFARLSSGKIVVETEACVVGSNTMTFDEYLDMRLINFIIYTTRRELVFDSLFKLLKNSKIEIFDLFLKMLREIDRAPENIREVFNGFKNATRDELWDSREELLDHYQKEDNYRKLLDGEDGINVLYHHYSLVTIKYMEEWIDYTFMVAEDMLKEGGLCSDNMEVELEEIYNYCRGVTFNPLGEDRMSTNPEYEFSFDIQRWLARGGKLGEYLYPQKKRISFRYTSEQYDFIEDLLRGERSIDNISKSLFTSQAVSADYLWRRPYV